MKMEIFYDMFDKECMDFQIFKYSDPFQIFQRLSCASNEDVVTIKERLITRYKKNGDLLKYEVKNMTKLCEIIDDYLFGKKITIKYVVLDEFSKEIRKLIQNYNDEKNQLQEEIESK